MLLGCHLLIVTYHALPKPVTGLLPEYWKLARRCVLEGLTMSALDRTAECVALMILGYQIGGESLWPRNNLEKLHHAHLSHFPSLMPLSSFCSRSLRGLLLFC